MKIIRIALLAAAVAACSAALAEPLDFRFELVPGGIPVPGGEVVYGLVVTVDLWTEAQEPFVVRVQVPQGLEPASVCTGEMGYDPSTRLLTWTDRLDNPYIALKSCPLAFRIDPAAVPGTAYTVSAALTTAAPDRNPGNNADTHTNVVLPASDLEVTSSVDLRRFKPGTVVTYTFTVTNHGPQDAYDTILLDELSPHVGVIAFEQTDGPAGRMIGTAQAVIPVLRAGESAAFRLVARAKADFEAADIRNRAVVYSASVDLHERNNETFQWTFAGPDADLAVTSRRENDTITIRVANDGPDSVNEVLVSSALTGVDYYTDVAESVKFASVTPSQGTCAPPVLDSVIATPPPPPYWRLDCTVGSLPPGAAATITAVLERAPTSGPIRLNSFATPAQNDPRPENNGTQLLIDAPRRRAVRK